MEHRLFVNKNRASSLPKKKGKTKKEPKTFGETEVDFSTIFPMPDGYEKLFLAIYFISIPYTVGLIFLFIFVARGHFENFMSLNLAMVVAVWAIGYEIVGSIALLIIFYKMFRFNKRKKLRTRTKEHSTNPLHQVHDFS